MGVELPVTVVIPAYNRRSTVVRAIRSAQEQSTPAAEIVVVDDASDDDTAVLAEREGVRVIRLASNSGAAHARNVAIANARQPWIAFLDADDEWFPHHLSTLWRHTESYSIIGGHNVVSGAGLREPRYRVKGRERRISSPEDLIFPDNPVSIGALLVKRAVLEAAGGFDEELRISEDFDLWIRLVETEPLLIIPDALYAYHQHPDQKTANVEAARTAQLELLERYRSREWWNELTFLRRAALSRAEIALSAETRRAVIRMLMRGIMHHPITYAPVVRTLSAGYLRRAVGGL